MTGIKYDTTWEQAQQMILENPAFADDDELLHMEKEDALIVFEDHIRELEAEEESERDKGPCTHDVHAEGGGGVQEFLDFVDK